MLINWFTVIAQIVNFLVLVLLLKHFLYDRIISVMDERKKKIGARLEEADQKEAEAEKRARELEEKKQALEDRRQAVLDQAKADAEVRRNELIKEARKEADDQERKWRQDLERKKEAMVRDLRRMVQEQVYNISKKALKELAGADVNQQAMHAFSEKLKEMDEEQKQAMASAIGKAQNEATVSSSIELSEEAKRQTETVLKDTFTDQIKIRYRTDADLVFGIELSTKGRKVAWSLSNYLRNLEEGVRAALDKESQEAKAD